MSEEALHPQLGTTVLDTEDARGLADFYHRLLGWEYSASTDLSSPDADEWVTLESDSGFHLSFQRVDHLQKAGWPSPKRPQQIHLDFTVDTVEQLKALHPRVLTLGANLLQDSSDDPEQLLYIYADPAGHPFCIYRPTM